jgi:hypothetical protein
MREVHHFWGFSLYEDLVFAEVAVSVKQAKAGCDAQSFDSTYEEVIAREQARHTDVLFTILPIVTGIMVKIVNYFNFGHP